MADARRSNSRADTSGQPSRLQQRRPASLQIAPSTGWNVAIPLLSPLVTSPTAVDRTAEMKSREEQHRHQAVEPEKRQPPVFKMWQHPAAPFCYDPATLKPSSFVPV